MSIKLGYMELFTTIEHHFEDVDGRENKIAIDVVLKVTPDWSDEENKPCFTIGTLAFRGAIGRRTTVWKALNNFFDDYFIEDDYQDILSAYEAFTYDVRSALNFDFPDHSFISIENQTIVRVIEAILKKIENTIPELHNTFQTVYKRLNNQHG